MVDEDDEDEDEDDDVVRVLRCAAGRAGLRRIVPADGVGAPGGGGGAEPASAPINPPPAPTTNPAVPNVGVRLSACTRRSGSAADAALATVGGSMARISLPVARARSSSGEW